MEALVAVDVGTGIEDNWKSLRENPVFKRTLLPRGFRTIIRSPISRAIGLSLIALSAYETINYYFLQIPVWTSFMLAVLFWFVIIAVQRYFCWIELTGLSRSGNLHDYLNSGLSRADVAMGVIMPAIISETLAIIGIFLWFLVTTDLWVVRIVLIIFIILRIRELISNPFIFHPDSESYMRKRNPVVLFFISFTVVVPILIWVSIYFALIYIISFGAGYLTISISFKVLYLLSVFGTLFISKYPVTAFMTWRLKRFYQRYESFDELFESYVE